MCKIIFYKWRNDMLNHIITSYTCFYLANIKKLGYKIHLLVKTQNCEFTSVKSIFTSVQGSPPKIRHWGLYQS